MFLWFLQGGVVPHDGLHNVIMLLGIDYEPSSDGAVIVHMDRGSDQPIVCMCTRAFQLVQPLGILDGCPSDYCLMITAHTPVQKLETGEVVPRAYDGSAQMLYPVCDATGGLYVHGDSVYAQHVAPDSNERYSVVLIDCLYASGDPLGYIVRRECCETSDEQWLYDTAILCNDGSTHLAVAVLAAWITAEQRPQGYHDLLWELRYAFECGLASSMFSFPTTDEFVALGVPRDHRASGHLLVSSQ